MLFYGYVFTNDQTASRVFRFGQRRVRAFAEVFNLVNDSTIFTRNETYSAVAAQNLWYNPINLVESRRLQFGFQLDF